MLALVTSCSDIDTTEPASTTTKYDGAWDVVGLTDAPPDSEGENCAYGKATGTLTISGWQLTGDITDNSGYAYAIAGTVDGSGKLSGGFTYEGYDAATFEGVLSSSEGTGRWADINGCPGDWLLKKTERIAKQSEQTGTDSNKGALAVSE